MRKPGVSHRARVVRLSAFAALVGVAIVSWLALRAAHPPARCGDGMVALGARCCGEGQGLRGDVCIGAATRCGGELVPTLDGCLPPRARVFIEGGDVRVGPSDWEAQGSVTPRELHVGRFWMDRFEIDRSSVATCVREGRCDASFEAVLAVPPGTNVLGDGGRAALLTFAQAKAFCAGNHGRLPTDDEWTFAAMGKTGRRYPWGETGAVCMRAAYGLVEGPCARGASGPDTVGSRPSGATPDGLQDLAGNAAEWTISAENAVRLRGGSFESSLATELRGWFSAASRGAESRAGARCAYDRPVDPLRLCDHSVDL